MQIHKQFNNGFELLIDQKENIHTVFAALIIKAGMLNEFPEQNGISHFLEHMLFKGTETKTAKQLIDFVEQKGGTTNAYTSTDRTCYTVNIQDKYWQTACDFLADISQNSIFPEDELEKEREVIIQEYKEHEADPNYLCYSGLLQTMYKGMRSGKTILGPLKNIKKFTAYDLYKYYKKHYIPEKMLFAITIPSYINADEVIEYLKQLFGSLPYGTQYIEHFKREEIIQGQNKSNRKEGIEQSYICMGIPSIPYTSKLRPAFEVFLYILDGGMSTRLFQIIREKLGLAYSVYTFEHLSTLAHAFCLGVVTEEKNENKACEAIKQTLKNMLNDISEEEFEKAKNMVSYNFEAALDQPNNISYSVNKLLYLNELFDFDKELKKIYNVKIEDIYAVIKELLKYDFTRYILRPEKRENKNENEN